MQHTPSPSLPAPLLNFGQRASLRYKFGFLRDGVAHYPTKWRDNLILDSGLNMVALRAWVNCFTHMLLGTAVTPKNVRRDSGATTFTQSGTTIIASTNFFEPADVGRLFKYGTGSAGVEVYITAYTSATVVSANISQTVTAPTVASIWYVNETALTTLDNYTHSYQQNGGDNGTSVTGNVITYKRTFIGAAVTGPKTFTEIGFNKDETNENIFDRDLITPPVSLVSGDQPIATVQVIVTVNPSTPTAVGNTSTGFDSSGNAMVEALGVMGGLGMANVQANGESDTGGGRALEAYDHGEIAYLDSPITFGTIVSGQASDRSGSRNSATNNDYTAGSFTRTSWATFSVGQANTTIYGFALVQQGMAPYFTLKLNTPFAKNSTQTLTLNFRKSWQRTLTN